MLKGRALQRTEAASQPTQPQYGYIVLIHPSFKGLIYFVIFHVLMILFRFIWNENVLPKTAK